VFSIKQIFYKHLLTPENLTAIEDIENRNNCDETIIQLAIFLITMVSGILNGDYL